MRVARLVTIFATATFAVFSACNSATEPPHQFLRVRNVGVVPISALRVSVPETSTEFGDFAAGATTSFERTNGVYPCAAFRYTVEGKVRYQPVLDFDGAVPKDGIIFTYNVELIRLTNDSTWLHIRSIKRDM